MGAYIDYRSDGYSMAGDVSARKIVPDAGAAYNISAVRKSVIRNTGQPEKRKFLLDAKAKK